MSTTNSARRRLLQALAGGSVITTSLPDTWSRPVVDSVLLPAHAQTTENGDDTVTTDACTSTSTIAFGGRITEGDLRHRIYVEVPTPDFPPDAAFLIYDSNDDPWGGDLLSAFPAEIHIVPLGDCRFEVWLALLSEAGLQFRVGTARLGDRLNLSDVASRLVNNALTVCQDNSNYLNALGTGSVTINQADDTGISGVFSLDVLIHTHEPGRRGYSPFRWTLDDTLFRLTETPYTPLCSL